jgi:hypothetical protein
MTHRVRIEDASSAEIQLERETYELVHEVLERLGAKYIPSARVHAWPYDPSDLLAVLRETGTMPAKNPLEFFATPPAICEEFRRRINPDEIDHCRYLAYLEREYGYEIRILEPSAGTGALATIAREMYPHATIHCCELDPYRRRYLESQGFTVVASDFLDYQLSPGEPGYDLILMNPPFGDKVHGNAAYIAHTLHAHTLLRDEESELHAVASAGFTFTSTQTYSDFFTFCLTHGDIEDLKRDAFKESGTGAATVLLWLGRDLLWPYNKMDTPHAGWPKASLWHLFLFFDNESDYSNKLWDLQVEMLRKGQAVFANGKPSEHIRQKILMLFHQFSRDMRRQRQHVPIRPEDEDAIIATVMDRYQENQQYLIQEIRKKHPTWLPPEPEEQPEPVATTLFDLLNSVAV